MFAVTANQEGGEMITWAERAKAAISQKSQNGTDKTDETPVLSVLSVDAEAVSVMAEGLSSVLSVPSPGYFENLQGARQETQALPAAEDAQKPPEEYELAHKKTVNTFEHLHDGVSNFDTGKEP